MAQPNQLGAFILGQPPNFNFELTDQNSGQLVCQLKIPPSPQKSLKISIFLTSNLPSNDYGFEIHAGFPELSDSFSGIGYLSNFKPSNILDVDLPVLGDPCSPSPNTIILGLQYTNLSDLQHQG